MKTIIRNVGMCGRRVGIYCGAGLMLVLSALNGRAVEVVVDNSDAAGVALTGTWTTSSSVSGYYGGNYFHDGNAGKGSKSVRFTPTLPQAGDYEVFARWPAFGSYANNTPVDVTGTGGTSTQAVNQQNNGGQWISLGTYAFAAGTGGYVTIRNQGTSGNVIADAVKFVSVSAIDLILDNSDTAGITLTGSWTASTSVGGYYGLNYLHDGNTGKGSKSIRFTPQLPSAGDYEVFTRWPSFSTYAGTVPIDIFHSGGMSGVQVDQRTDGGQWISLGTYSFSAGSAGYVTVGTAGTSGFVIADAMRFTSVGEAPESPWGIAVSDQSLSASYSTSYPKMAAAGVKWMRAFTTWQGVQPTSGGAFVYTNQDTRLAAAAANGLQLVGFLGQSTTWASGNAAYFPMSNLPAWSNYVSNTVSHFSPTVKYWEVWNEPEANRDPANDTAADYATLVVNAYAPAKLANPSCKVGMSFNNFDVPFIGNVVDSLVTQGKSDHFDFICIHPYELTGRLLMPGGETYFLNMVSGLKAMLAEKCPSRVNVPIWITEEGARIGDKTIGPVTATTISEPLAANLMVKTYTMGIAQGIKRICWYDDMDTSATTTSFYYGWGLLKSDGTERASYKAMKAMTTHMGSIPQYLGWLQLNTDNKGFGFVYQGSVSSVMAAWMPAGTTGSTVFSSNVTVVNIQTNTTSTLTAGTPLALSDTPVLVVGLPASLVATAQSHLNTPYPWHNTGSLTTVSCDLGATHVNNGVEQSDTHSTPVYTFADGTDGRKVLDAAYAGNAAAYFSVQPTFANYNPHTLYVRVTARRITANTAANISLNYGHNGNGVNATSIYPYKAKSPSWSLPGTDNTTWYTTTWTLTDAAFNHTFGYDLYMTFSGSPFVIGKVEVSKNPSFQ